MSIITKNLAEELESVMFDAYSYLYVEDDAFSREILRMVMDTVMGVTRLTCFDDSHRLLERLEALNAPPDIIFLDVHVKPIDGFAMLDIIRQSEKLQQVHVLALTASLTSQEIAKLRSSGFDGAIAKPISVSTFPDLIARILQGESVWHLA